MKSESPRLNMLLLSGSLMLASTATGRALPPLQHSFTGVIENIDFTERTITLKAEKDQTRRDFLWSDSTQFRLSGRMLKAEPFRVGSLIRGFYRRELGKLVLRHVVVRPAGS